VRHLPFIPLRDFEELIELVFYTLLKHILMTDILTDKDDDFD